MKKEIVLAVFLSLSLVGCANSEEPKKVEDNGTEETDIEQKEVVKEVEADTIISNMGNTSGNIQNGGIATEYGNLIFYSDATNLYVAPKDEISDMENVGVVLDSVGRRGLINSINVINDYVYYVKDEQIFKMGVDGEGKEQISTPVPVSNMIVYKDQIIFTSYNVEYDSFDLYKIGVNGENLTEKASNITNFYVDQGKLYWSIHIKEDEYSLNIDSLDNEGEPEVKSYYNINSFQVNGNDLYYLNKGDYFKVSLDGIGRDNRNLTANRKGARTTIDLPNIFKDTIYYTEDQKMFAMDSTGLKRWEVPTSSVYAYSVAGGHLFYWGFGQGEYSLAVYTNVENAYNQAMDARDHAAEATEGWGTPPELLQLYDDLYYLEEPISIEALEEQENQFVGGEILFPQEHVVGATKALLYGLSNRNEELLKSLLTDPEGQYNDLFLEGLGNAPLEGVPYGGYYDYEITVLSDDAVYIYRDQDDLSITAVFKEIDGKYYFDKFVD